MIPSSQHFYLISSEQVLKHPFSTRYATLFLSDLFGVVSEQHVLKGSLGRVSNIVLWEENTIFCLRKLSFYKLAIIEMKIAFQLHVSFVSLPNNASKNKLTTYDKLKIHELKGYTA